MLAIYDGEVSVIELVGIDIETTYRQISINPDYGTMKFLFTKNGRPIGAGSLGDFIDNTVIPKTFLLEGDFFAEARKYCVGNHVKYNTFFPLVNTAGECVWLLFYMENKVHESAWTQGVNCEQFKNYDLSASFQALDFTLLEDFDVYVFIELEEYTHAIARVLQDKWPEKQVYFKDKKALELFGERIGHFRSGIYKELKNKKCIFITSDGKNHEREQTPEVFLRTYSSLSVMSSLIWISKKEHLGDLNKGKTIFILDANLIVHGLVDIIKYTYAYYLIAKERNWELVVDYSRKPNQYLNAEGENMWEYFFEPLSTITLEEAKQSDLVIRASVNNIELNGRINPYWRYWKETEEHEYFMKMVNLNRETQEAVERLMPEELKKGYRVLGVVARGTDYRKEANESASRTVKVAGIDKMIKRVRYVMDLWQCEYVFAATEDEQYFACFQQEFGQNLLSIEQPRVYHDYSGAYIPVSDLLKVKDGKQFGRTYLAVIAALAKCNVLLSNMINGTYEAAKSLNDGLYEWCEIVRDEASADSDEGSL